MSHPISDFSGKWINSVYKYLKESGGGPTYPPKTVTVGAGVLPTGGYSLVEDYPVTYDIPITKYGTIIPIPFNSGAMGLPVIDANKNDSIEEIAKENPVPTVLSSNFQRLYGDMMNACIADQVHRCNNPNASSACQKLASIGDPSEMILTSVQKEAIGLTPIPQQNNKSAEVQLAENDAALTTQFKNTWSGFAGAFGQGLVADPSGNRTLAGDPGGVNFQSLNDRLKGFIPGLPNVPRIDTGSIMMIGGAVVLVVLLITIVKIK